MRSFLCTVPYYAFYHGRVSIKLGCRYVRRTGRERCLNEKQTAGTHNELLRKECVYLQPGSISSTRNLGTTDRQNMRPSYSFCRRIPQNPGCFRRTRICGQTRLHTRETQTQTNVIGPPSHQRSKIKDQIFVFPVLAFLSPVFIQTFTYACSLDEYAAELFAKEGEARSTPTLVKH